MRRFGFSARTWTILGTTLAGLLLAGLMHWQGLARTLELRTLDLRFQSASRPALADSSVVLATIDESSIQLFEERGIRWPWPREFYGRLVEYFHRGGAEAIVFDMLFLNPDFERVNTNADSSDARFARAMREAGNVVLGASLRDRIPADGRDSTASPVPFHVPRYSELQKPIPSFLRTARSIGAVIVEPDPDGTVRRVPLLYRAENELVPHLSLAGYRTARTDTSRSDLAHLLERIPTGPRGSFLLYWYGPGGADRSPFSYVPVAPLMRSAIQIDLGEEPQIPPDRFAGKTIVIGSSAMGLQDFQTTPVSGTSPYPGMEIYATMLSNLRQGHYLRPLPTWAAYGIALLLGLGMAWIVTHRPEQVLPSIAMSALLVGSYGALAFGTFYGLRLWLPLVIPIVSAGATFGLAGIVSYAREGRERRTVQKTFSRYMSPQVVEEVLENPDDLRLGGKEVTGTVFFSDIEGFTSISEHMNAPEVVGHLNEYLSTATDALIDREAMIDKYIGDAIMAVFGAPVQREDHARQACLAALDVQAVLQEEYQRPDRDGPTLRTRIGIHTGPLVVGNVGVRRRLDYTAIGDTVNLAARLEGVNKQFRTNILISEQTYRAAEEDLFVREIDVIRVKGKQEPVRIFELIDRPDAASAEDRELVDRFERGLSAYRSRRFDQALKTFRSVLELAPEDGPAQTYVSRCRELEPGDLPDAWDGVYSLSEK